METLAPELLAAITDDLDTPELASLMDTSQSLGNFIEPKLYGSVERREKTLHWACANGNTNHVRRAISHGSSPSLVEPFPPRRAPVLTLFLAAKHNQHDTFSFLLDLGAGISPPLQRAHYDSIRNQVKSVMGWLSNEANLDLLHLFLNKGLDDEVKRMHCPAVAWPLVPTIRSGASTALVRTLLDHGASPDMVLSNGKNTMQSPLSAAILAGAYHVARELLAGGANVGGHRRREDVPPYPGQYPTHLPMFAAAALLAKSEQGGEAKDMLTTCLQYGGNINQHASFVSRSSRVYWTTPLLVFLETVPAWNRDSHDRLTFLIDQGASGPPTDGPKPEVPTSLRRLDPYCGQPPSTVVALFDRWGLEGLAQDDFFTVVGLLIRRGLMSTADIEYMLDRNCRIYDVEDSQAKAVRSQWCRLLDIVVSQIQASVDVDGILASVILSYGSGKIFAPKSRFMLEATVDHLLVKHGANINACTAPTGQTALHNLCKFYCKAATNFRIVDFESIGAAHVAGPRTELFSLLLQRGADPTLTFDGKTASEVLLEGCDKTNRRNGTFLLGLVNVIGKK